LSTSLPAFSAIKSLPSLRDRWVAIDTAGCTRGEVTPLRVQLDAGAVVVDADEELGVLCRRIKAERRTSLTIVYAG